MVFQRFSSAATNSSQFARLPLVLLGGMAAIALLSGVSGCQLRPSKEAKAKQAVETIKAADTSSAATKAAKIALAEHLSSSGAKMFGTFWCPYCHRQQELFGAAVDRLAIVECDPKGANAKPETCTSANVSSYPSWEINGKLYLGMRSLSELASLSGYKGSTAFGE